MPQQVSDLNIQNDIFQLLDKVIKTGVPVEIERKGKRLLISPTEKRRDLDSLEEHPEYIIRNPDDLVHIDMVDRVETAVMIYLDIHVVLWLFLRKGDATLLPVLVIQQHRQSSYPV